MTTRGLVDLREVDCKLVPDAVEIDALASHDKPLGIWTAEGAMPEQGMAHEVVPGGMPGTGASITTSCSVWSG
jgi:hypothetical protein